jgi:hypothetical protein
LRIIDESQDTLALGIPLATMAASGAGAEDTPSGAAPWASTAVDKKPLFPDDGQFWYETQRAFGAAEYGGKADIVKRAELERRSNYPTVP